MRILRDIRDRIQGKIPKGAKRSSRWPQVRKAHLAANPFCAVCGGDKKLEVHHIKPFHIHPELELDARNLITLCEAKKNGLNCHLFFGHLGNFKSVNLHVRQNANDWHFKLVHRPKGEK